MNLSEHGISDRPKRMKITTLKPPRPRSLMFKNGLSDYRSNCAYLIEGFQKTIGHFPTFIKALETVLGIQQHRTSEKTRKKNMPSVVCYRWFADCITTFSQPLTTVFTLKILLMLFKYLVGQLVRLGFFRDPKSGLQQLKLDCIVNP